MNIVYFCKKKKNNTLIKSDAPTSWKHSMHPTINKTKQF